nr:MAG TPA: hypothetical protein [Caudoviricetes sp.]
MIELIKNINTINIITTSTIILITYLMGYFSAYIDRKNKEQKEKLQKKIILIKKLLKEKEEARKWQEMQEQIKEI